MLNQSVHQRSYLEIAVDAVMLVLGFCLAFWVRLRLDLPMEGGRPLVEGHLWLISLGVPLYWLLAHQAGLYTDRRHRGSLVLIRSVTWVFLELALVLGTAVFLFQAKGSSRAVFFLFLAFAGALVILGRLLLIEPAWGRSERLPRRNVLIVGSGSEARDFARKVLERPEWRLRIVGNVVVDDRAEAEPEMHVLGSMADLRQLVEQHVVDDVVFAVPVAALGRCEQAIWWCEEVGVTVHLVTEFVRTLFARTYSSDLDGTPMLTVAPTPRDPLLLGIKRLLDVAVSGSALAMLSPLLLLTAVLVKLTSPGPVLFVQRRVGLNGRVFDLYKFRSMTDGAEGKLAELAADNEVSGPVFKMRRDPRITTVGRWLRRFSLDELPQLWNVLRGDMSLVGPRPPIPDEVRRYERWQRRRLSMKPGLTCLWQVGGRSQVGFEEWMRLDLAYIDNWSLGLDIKILLRTVPAVLLARGAH